MTYTIGIDIGGTFTDSFATDDAGNVVSAKSHSTPPDFERGVLGSIEELASLLGMGISDLLPDVSYICHGTTSSLNALVTGNVAQVGLLTTAGHSDSTYIMNVEGRYAGLGAEEIQDVTRTNKPRPLVSKSFVRDVVERVDHKGAVIVPLDEDAARESIRDLVDLGAQAIAISLLWSFRNSDHELRLRDLVNEIAPGMYVAISSEVSPRIREYARTSTTIMSAQVAPTLEFYLNPLTEKLRSLGFTGSLLVMQGSGGSISAEEAPKQAITTVGSILTGGVIGCQQMGLELGHENVISTDMGGTTFLVGMVVDGKPVTSPTSILNQFTLNTPMVRVSAIGGGGGAIARLDSGGNLKVGPEGAGASPGPACYALTGTRPTITDANVVMGILNPDNFLGGRKTLRRDLAENAIREHVADPLGMSVEEAAGAIYSIATSQAADLVRRVVVNEGHDPRDFALYAFGGAAPAHCCTYARDIGASEVLVPLGSTASTFSAYGLAASNVILSAEISRPTNFPADPDEVNELFRQLEGDVNERLAKQGVEFTKVTLDRQVDMRYTMQLAEVSTPVRNGVLTEGEVLGIGDDFEALYERLYGKGAGFREAGLQLITYRVFGTGHLPFRPSLPLVNAGAADLAPRSRRAVILDPHCGFQDTAVYDYRDLGKGHEIHGPALIESATTTVALPESTAATVDRFGNLTIQFG